MRRYVRSRRWFGGKDRAVVRQKVIDVISLGRQPAPALVMIEISFADVLRAVLVAHRGGQRAAAADVMLLHPEAVIAAEARATTPS